MAHAMPVFTFFLAISTRQANSPVKRPGKSVLGRLFVSSDCDRIELPLIGPFLNDGAIRWLVDPVVLQQI